MRNSDDYFLSLVVKFCLSITVFCFYSVPVQWLNFGLKYCLLVHLLA